MSPLSNIGGLSAEELTRAAEEARVLMHALSKLPSPSVHRHAGVLGYLAGSVLIGSAALGLMPMRGTLNAFAQGLQRAIDDARGTGTPSDRVAAGILAVSLATVVERLR